MIPTQQQLRETADAAYVTACRHEWIDPGRHAEIDMRPWRELIAGAQGEFHEALRELRRGRKVDQIVRANGVPIDLDTYDPRDGAPHGVLVELADVVLRVLTMCKWYGAPVHAQQPPSPSEVLGYKGLGAKDLCECQALVMRNEMRPLDLYDVMHSCLEWAHVHGHDLWRVVQLKLRYNETRPYRHGDLLF